MLLDLPSLPLISFLPWSDLFLFYVPLGSIMVLTRQTAHINIPEAIRRVFIIIDKARSLKLSRCLQESNIRGNSNLDKLRVIFRISVMLWARKALVSVWCPLHCTTLSSEEQKHRVVKISGKIIWRWKKRKLRQKQNNNNRSFCPRKSLELWTSQSWII